MFITLTASNLPTGDYTYKGPTEGKVVLRADETRQVTLAKPQYQSDGRRGSRVLTTYGAVFIVEETPEEVALLLVSAAKKVKVQRSDPTLIYPNR